MMRACFILYTYTRTLLISLRHRTPDAAASLFMLAAPLSPRAPTARRSTHHRGGEHLRAALSRIVGRVGGGCMSGRVATCALAFRL